MLKFSFQKLIVISIFAVGIYLLLIFSNILPKRANVFDLKITQNLNKTLVVKEVNEIGKLTASRFYGEVFSDLTMVYDSICLKAIRDKEHNNNNLHFPYFSQYMSFYKPYSALTEKLKAHNVAAGKYQALLDTLQLRFKNNRKKYVSREDKAAALRKIEETKRELSRLRQQIPYEKVKLEQATRRLQYFRKKRNLIYIGRGEVRATVDFAAIANQQVELKNQQGDSLSVLLSEPIRFETTINPWFVEGKVKGFELFDSYGGEFTAQEIQAVKQLCVQRLENSALEKGIRKHAVGSIRKTIGTFFAALGHTNIIFEVDSANDEAK